MSVVLAERCEAASGPCTGLDADIELATGNWSREHYEAWQRYQECGESANPSLYQPVGPNRYTSSLDAAMTLVLEKFDHIEVYPPQLQYTKWTVHIIPMERGIMNTHTGYAVSHPLALCAAALRARA